MLGQAKQVGFVGVSDLDAAELFYGGVLGLELVDARPYALVHETSASQLGSQPWMRFARRPTRSLDGSLKT